MHSVGFSDPDKTYYTIFQCVVTFKVLFSAKTLLQTVKHYFNFQQGAGYDDQAINSCRFDEPERLQQNPPQ